MMTSAPDTSTSNRGFTWSGLRYFYCTLSRRLPGTRSRTARLEPFRSGGPSPIALIGVRAKLLVATCTYIGGRTA